MVPFLGGFATELLSLVLNVQGCRAWFGVLVLVAHCTG